MTKENRRQRCLRSRLQGLGQHAGPRLEGEEAAQQMKRHLDTGSVHAQVLHQHLCQAKLLGPLRLELVLLEKPLLAKPLEEGNTR